MMSSSTSDLPVSVAQSVLSSPSVTSYSSFLSSVLSADARVRSIIAFATPYTHSSPASASTTIPPPFSSPSFPAHPAAFTLSAPSVETGHHSASSVSAGPERRSKLPLKCVYILRAWFSAHVQYPYPSAEEKRLLAAQTGLSIEQINHFMCNTRRRFWLPFLKRTKPEAQTQREHSDHDGEDDEASSGEERARRKKAKGASQRSSARRVSVRASAQ